MPATDQSPELSSQANPWQRILPCLIVFAAAFVLFGLTWPAMSPGVRASLSLDFYLPEAVSGLSASETDLFKSTIANQVSNQLTGQEFDSLIRQTHRTGKVVSPAIEYSDRESIVKNLDLAFAMDSTNGRLQLDYVCQGSPDQIRFLQLLGQRLAHSIENLAFRPESGIVAGGQLNREKFDRAIWLANQIQSDLDQIRSEQDGAQGDVQSRRQRTSPYSFASANHISNQESLSQQQQIATNALNSIDADSLTGLLTEIKSESGSRRNEATLSVLKVDPVKVWAINATPDRWAMVGLLAMAGMVSGFFALYQIAPTRPATSVKTLSQSLGIPVVAVLTADQNPHAKTASVEFFSTLASTLLVAAKIFLLVVTVIVIGFMLIDSSIRESFFQNPFNGVAKIFRVFFGYA